MVQIENVETLKSIKNVCKNLCCSPFQANCFAPLTFGQGNLESQLIL